MKPASIGNLLWMALVILSSSVLSGCFLNFYKATPVASGEYRSALKDALQSNRYFVFHQGGKVYGVTDLRVDEATQHLSPTLDTLPANHSKYALKDDQKTYSKSRDTALLTEVHLYSIDSIDAPTGETTQFPISKLQKLEIIQHDTSKSTTNHILSIIGVTVGTLSLVLVIALLMKSSCPFVSGYTGNEFKLQGEIFGGAIYPQLQREDYLPLSLQPVKNELMVRISNELLERQYTDMAELWCVDHDPSMKIVQDEKGNLYSVSEMLSPRYAGAADINLSEKLSRPDDRYFDFNTINNDAASEVNLSFDLPSEKLNALLLLRLRNSYWIDLTYGELIKNFGSYFNKWSEQQKGRSVHEINKWKQEQQLPLKIEMRTSRGWEQVALLETIGPVAFRDVAVPLDLKNIHGNNLELRLSTGFMFWELDHVSLSYDKQLPFVVHKQKPVQAYDENGKDVLHTLMSAERNYLYQPVPGNVATIHFRSPQLKPGKQRSYLLRASGYYEHVRSFKGSPNISELKKFRKAGSLSRLSYERYQQALSGLKN